MGGICTCMSQDSGSGSNEIDSMKFLSPEPRMKRQVVVIEGDCEYSMLNQDSNLTQGQDSRNAVAKLLMNGTQGPASCKNGPNFIIDEDERALRNITPKSLKDRDHEAPEIFIDSLPIMTVEDQILENYKSELAMIGPEKANFHSELLTVLFGAYSSLLKELITSKTYIQRFQIINRIDQQNWKLQRLAYKSLVNSQFDEIYHRTEQLAQITCHLLRLNQSAYFSMMTQIHDQDQQQNLQGQTSPSPSNLIKQTQRYKSINERIVDKVSQLKIKYNLIIPNQPQTYPIELQSDSLLEIQHFIDDVKREQIYFDVQLQQEKTQRQNQLSLNPTGLLAELHVNLNLSQSSNGDDRKTRDSSDIDDATNSDLQILQSENQELQRNQKDQLISSAEIRDIIVQGFEIEDRLFMKYGISLDQYYQCQENNNMNQQQQQAQY